MTLTRLLKDWKIQDKAVSVKNENISIYATGMIGKAIEIVKQGGVSDDVCERRKGGEVDDR